MRDEALRNRATGGGVTGCDSGNGKFRERRDELVDELEAACGDQMPQR